MEPTATPGVIPDDTTSNQCEQCDSKQCESKQCESKQCESKCEIIHRDDNNEGEQVCVDTPTETDTVEAAGESVNDEYDANDPDQVDKFKLKKLLSCAAKRFLPKDEDTEPYGFSDKHWETSKLYDAGDENTHYETDRSRKNRVSKNESFKKALGKPMPIGTKTLESRINASKDNVYLQKRVPDPYPCQTNAQFHPNPKSTRSNADEGDEDRYDFSHQERGYIVMIVNDRFKIQQHRDGAHLDLQKMKEVSRKLGFKILNSCKEKNLSKPETLQLLRRAQQTDHSKCDCFMFMISSHGLEQRNALAGGKPDHALVCADEQLIFTSSILEMFNDQNCPSLKNKPKIFIIQACRGDNLDHGSDVFVAFERSVDATDVSRPPLVTDDNNEERYQSRSRLGSNQSVDEGDTKPGPGSWPLPQMSSVPKYYTPKVKPFGGHVPFAPSHHINRIYAPTPYAIVDTPSLRCDNDMLVMYAIPEGMFAWRNTNDGSWMIDYLHQVFMAYDMRRPKNLLLLLTKVSAIMSRRTTNTPSSRHMDQKKAIPVIEHKLCKDVIFQQKVVATDWSKQIKH